jgi:hypothetical protein
MSVEAQIKDAQEALLNAHNAGDETAAQQIADHIVSLQSQQQMTAPELANRTIGNVAGAAVGGIGGAALGRSLQSGIREEYPNMFKNAPATPAPQAGIPNVTVTGSPSAPKTGGENWVKSLTGADIPDAQMAKKDLDLAKGMRETVGRGGPLAGGSITEGGIMVGPKTTAEMAREVKEAKEAASKTTKFKGVKEAAKTANRNVGHMMHGMSNPWAIKTLGNALAGAGAGMQAADAYQRFTDPEQGWIRGAISGIGALGSGAAMTRIPAAMPIGTALGVGAPFLNEYLDEFAAKNPKLAKKLHLADGGSVTNNNFQGGPEHIMEKAKGGAVQYFNKGKAVESGVKGVTNLAKKFGYDPKKVAKDYPDVLPPVLAVDPKKGTEYLAKQLSPEALAVQKARKAAQMEIDKGQYSPLFDLKERYHVNPANYPLPQRTLDITMPKKAETAAAHRAKATSPEAIQRLEAAYERGAVHPGAHDFYAMGQLEDAFVKELGPEAGRAAFKSRFADPLAATTGGADPNSNLMTAAYTNFMRERGMPLPEATHQLPFPVGGRYVASNIDQARKYRELGGLDPASNPKRYNFSSNFQGHLDRPTIDEQMMNLFDPKGPKAPPWYGVQEDVVNELARKRGVTPVNYQEVAWAGGKNYEGKPMMQEINEMIQRTSRITGDDPEEVLKGFIHGNRPMYGIGAGGLGMGAMEEEQGYAEGGGVRGRLAGGLGMLPMSARSELRRRGQTADRSGIQAAMAMSDPAVAAAYNSVPGDIMKLAAMYANPIIGAGMAGGQMMQAASEGEMGDSALLGGLGALGVAGNIPKGVRAMRGVANSMAQSQRNPSLMDRMYSTGAPDEGVGAVPAMAGGGSVLRGVIDDVMKGYGSKAAKEIAPGAPHTYPPQVPAGTQWMRDYEPAARPAPEITYMGKYFRGTPETRAVAKAAQEDAMRSVLEARKQDYIEGLRNKGYSEEDIMSAIAGSPWIPR